MLTVAIYSVVKFREAGRHERRRTIRRNTRLEIIWVTIPFLEMVTALAIWLQILNNVEAKKPNERTNVVRGSGSLALPVREERRHRRPRAPAAAPGPGQVTSNTLEMTSRSTSGSAPRT